ncbi:MAG: M48 family metallopeptidase [Tissierellaceae bacterium]|nr:M48 family metallopeptidase [Tissierellaceae bacterium]
MYEGRDYMNRKLKFVFLIFFVLLISFIFIILYSEKKNMDELRTEYPNISEKAYSYRNTNLKIWGLSLFLKFLIPILFLTTGFSSYIQRYAKGNGRGLFLTAAIYILIFSIVDFIIDIPLNYYGNFVIQHRYGLSAQSIYRWLEMELKGFGLNLIISIIVGWFPFYLIKMSPSRWWLYLGIIAIPIFIFVNIISPMYIDPIFNKYTELKDKELEADIKKLLEKAGIENAQIYEVDKSKDTNTMNAYMTGILKSKRIVLWDTTINKLTRQETVNVTAHEMGHYVNNHIIKSTIVGGISTILLLFLVNKTSLWILKNSRGIFGFKNLYEVAAIPLLILCLNFYLFLSSPVSNWYSRKMEWEADKYELDITKNKGATVSSLEKIYEESLSIPRPSNIYKIWYYSHPSLEERVKFAENYKFENKLP